MYTDSILKDVGKNLSMTLDSGDLKPDGGSSKYQYFTDVKNDSFDKYGFIAYGYDKEIYEKVIEMRIPVDAWGFKQWLKLWKDIYFTSFERNCPIKRQQFNNVFSAFLYEARDTFDLSNAEIADYLYWFSSSYISYLTKNNKPFNFMTIKYRLNDYFTQRVKPNLAKEKMYGKRIRDVVIDPKYLKESIDLKYKDHCDILVRQLGLPILLFYNFKHLDNGSKKCVDGVLDYVNQRSNFELQNNQSFDDYITKIIYNSIYFGPYPFEKRMEKVGVPSWREIFDDFIQKKRIYENPWWMNNYPEREPLECVKIFSRKRRIRRSQDVGE